ncbi:MAG: cell division protein FtsL [Anaerovibrio sp.]|uniref:FtsB family cell division protein n=1 Tax=Anaerovibrio sp. TaxID=1872532 RepID=UPI0025C10DB1|nr:cell division protein FtsL [Anaerovibrio sp.]MBE6099101.1 septum formation initiator family protein [Anaerovibrio sp.]MBQ3853132.1 cell division protein FtsL [Anaerovibrio sp.]
MSVVKTNFEKPQRRQINWFAIIMIILFLLAAFKLGEQAITYRDLSQDRIKAEERLKAAQEENEKLMNEKAQLDDPEYVEKLAREQLGMTKQGEIPYVYSKK